MLLITRMLGQSVKLGDDIEIKITRLTSKQVQLGFIIPENLRVLRDNAKVTTRITDKDNNDTYR